MEGDMIRELRMADPFRPFNLIMDDGRRLPVDKPYYLVIAPDVEFLVHSSVGGGFEVIDPSHVEDVNFARVRRPRRRETRAPKNGRRR